MTLVVTHGFVSGVADDPGAASAGEVLPSHWNANHSLVGQAAINQGGTGADLSATGGTGQYVKQAGVGAAFTVGTIPASDIASGGNLTGVNDTNVTLTLGGTPTGALLKATSLTLGWTGTLGLSRGGTAADLSATGGAGQYLKQASLGGAVTVGTIPASDIASGAALTKTDDTNVTLTLGGTPATALLKASSLTLGWTGTLAASRGGFGADVSAQSGVPLFATGVATFTGTTGSGNFARATSPTFVTPVLGTPTSGTLTNCTGLPLGGLATQAANTLLGNLTGSSASPTAFTIDGLTLKGTPASTDEVIIWDIAGSAIKKATVSGIGASSGVSSIASNTGAFTLAGGVTNSTNQIQLDGNYTGFAIPNLTLVPSVATNILTVAVKDNAGNDPSATSPIYINFRDPTASSGDTTLVSVTAALSITTNATGATLGSSNSTAFRFWVVAFNNSGTAVLALINCSTVNNAGNSTIFPLNEGAVASSTAISGSATSAGVFYTPNGTTVTSKPFRILGYVEYNSTGLATAGTYATAPNFVQVMGPGIRKPGEIVQIASNMTSTVGSTSTTGSFVNLASGQTQAITPTSAANPLRIMTQGSLDGGTSSNTFLQIVRGSTLIGQPVNTTTGTILPGISIFSYDLPNTTSSTTYQVQAKINAGTLNYPRSSAGSLLEVMEFMG